MTFRSNHAAIVETFSDTMDILSYRNFRIFATCTLFSDCPYMSWCWICACCQILVVMYIVTIYLTTIVVCIPFYLVGREVGRVTRGIKQGFPLAVEMGG